MSKLKSTGMKWNFLLTILLTSLASCWEKSPTDRITLTDADRHIPLHYDRFDQALFHSERPSISSLRSKFGNYTCAFTQAVFNQDCTTRAADSLLEIFTSDAAMKQAHLDIETMFTPSEMSSIEAELNVAFQRFHAMFPQRPLPSIRFIQSGWSSNVFITDTIISIALESYLGPDNPGIKNLPSSAVPQYHKDDMQKEFMVADVCQSWAKIPVQEEYQDDDLLRNLIELGKAIYIAECMIPDASQESMMKWTTEELKWAEENEFEIWKILAHQDVLYDKRQREIAKWFSPGPFTGVNGVPQGSPPQLGPWIGWRMVHQFMAKNENYTVEMLIQEKDKQKILAAYVPKRKS
ncbi:MAG: hypothetical protein ACKO66_06160 [Flavobacteriales bacterium]